MTTAPIAFIDLAAQRRRLGEAIDQAMLRVVDQGNFIMGSEVKTFESDLAAFCGAKNVIACANGTDALALVLMAKNVKTGDAVFCPSFTFAATAEVVALVGATPVFVDVLEDSFNLDPASLEAAIDVAKKLGLNPTAVIPVDLFGQPADYHAIMLIAERERLWIISDAAQSFGASYYQHKVGTLGLVTTTSFFPAKPLGCYGDGGAIFTEDDELAAVLRSLRVHGQGSDKYDNVRIGTNSRLDTLQAAILIEKLKIFPDEIVQRDRVAERYNQALHNFVAVPRVHLGSTSVWAQYTLRLLNGARQDFQNALKAAGVPTAVYYAKPLHQQTAYRHYPFTGNGMPISERLAEQVVSLPMHPYLTEETQDYIIAAVIDALTLQSRSTAE